MSEQILRQIPKQRRSVENYQQPFPAPEVDEAQLGEDVIALLERIDAATEDTAA